LGFHISLPHIFSLLRPEQAFWPIEWLVWSGLYDFMQLCLYSRLGQRPARLLATLVRFKVVSSFFRTF
jgi:hypothetical protein